MQSQLGAGKVNPWEALGPKPVKQAAVCWLALGPSLVRWHGEPETTSCDVPSLSQQVLVLAGCGGWQRPPCSSGWQTAKLTFGVMGKC